MGASLYELCKRFVQHEIVPFWAGTWEHRSMSYAKGLFSMRLYRSERATVRRPLKLVTELTPLYVCPVMLLLPEDSLQHMNKTTDVNSVLPFRRAWSLPNSSSITTQLTLQICSQWLVKSASRSSWVSTNTQSTLVLFIKTFLCSTILKATFSLHLCYVTAYHGPRYAKRNRPTQRPHTHSWQYYRRT